MSTKSKREFFSILLLIVVVGILVLKAWFPQVFDRSSVLEEPAADASKPEMGVDLEEKILTLQVQMLVGAEQYFRSHEKQIPQHFGSYENLRKVLREQYASKLVGSQLNGEKNQSSEKVEAPSESVLTGRMIACMYFGFTKEANEIKLQLEARKFDNASVSILLRYFQNWFLAASVSEKELETWPELEGGIEDIQQLEKLGWFGSLMISKISGIQDSQLSKNSQLVHEVAEKTFSKIVVVIAVGSVLIVISILAFVGFAILIMTRRIRSKFQALQIAPSLCLEVFVLYLSAMLLMPTFFSLFGRDRSTVSPLLLSVIAILSLTVIVFWPLFFGSKLKDLFHSFGIYLSSFGSFVSDLIIAPLVYLSSWIFIGAILVVYSMVLEHFQVNPSSGVHPIVPILVSSNDQSTLILTLILTVGVAPFVEEIMFRGVFYAWLRSHFSVMPSILISSLVFASIHPQGLIGVLPLSAIGIVLAIVREWRGSLLPCMLTHACFNAGTLALVLLIMK